MTPILQRIYQSEGGSEVCDTLMKYIYKGMGQGQSEAAVKTATPQQTGFTQVGGRSFGGAEGGGQAMSVLLSWHEKVSLICSAVLKLGIANRSLSLSSWPAREALSGRCLTAGLCESLWPLMIG
jgi:hypothetical protein